MQLSTFISIPLFGRGATDRKSPKSRTSVDPGACARFPALALGPMAALLATTLLSSPAEARYTSIVVDVQTGTVLEADNPDANNYPASLTKMMTLYLTFEALDRKRLTLDQELPVSQHAANQAPSKLGLQPGETIRVEDAILAVVTKSANDIAVVLAEALGGGEGEFAAEMTRKARALGMSRTTFRNASGLPNDSQVSTPRDMATLGQALVEDWPQYYHYFSRSSFTYNGQTIANHNHLMARYPGMDGIKTGFINKSGFNLVASAVRYNHRLVAAVFGGPSHQARDVYMASLLDAAFRHIAEGKAAPAIARSSPDPERIATADNGDTGKDNEGAAGDKDDEPEAAPPVVVKAATGHLRPPASRPALHGRWAVQLGAFPSEAAGRRALDRAARHLPVGVGHPGTALHSAGSHRHKAFQALLVGFASEKAAHLACSKISRVHACSVVAEH